MSQDQAEWIVATEEAKTLPVNELLTGRGLITGKSGAGKSNTGSVIAEELLDAGCRLFVVDTEGEYFGLKERYEVLHAGDDDRCDVQVTAEDSETLARLALEYDVPVVLDVSGYFDIDDAKEIVETVVASLFRKENDFRKPLLLMVEEMQEYLPQTGGSDDLSKLLLRVAKRGRKRGLGLCGLTQRPSAVDKDFITQCDWLTWHRLTWQTDVEVVRQILGKDVAEEVPELDTGEAFLMTDWDETVERVQFRRKKTFDAGATPGEGTQEVPDLKPVDRSLVDLFDGETAIEDIDPDSFSSSEPNRSASADDDAESESLNELAGDLALEGEIAGEPEEQKPEPADGPSEEVQKELARERRRNEMLQDEVKELKSILENVSEQNVEFADESESAAQTEAEAEVEPSVDDPDGDDRTPLRLEATRPPEEQGPDGVLVEFGQMVNYLLLSVGTRLVRLGRLLLGGARSLYGAAAGVPTSTEGRGRDLQIVSDSEGGSVGETGFTLEGIDEDETEESKPDRRSERVLVRTTALLAILLMGVVFAAAYLYFVP